MLFKIFYLRYVSNKIKSDNKSINMGVNLILQVNIIVVFIYKGIYFILDDS